MLKIPQVSLKVKPKVPKCKKINSANAIINKTNCIEIAQLSIGSIIAFYATGLFKNKPKLEKKIDFKEAATLQEAKEFANNHLKIPPYRYDIYDLELVNYLNEAIATFNNNSSNHTQVINSIDSEEIESGGRALMRSGPLIGGFLSIDLSKVYTLDELIKNSYPNFNKEELDLIFQFFDISKTQKELLKKYLNAPKALDLKEKMHLYQLLPLLNIENVSLASVYADILSDKTMEYMIKKENFPNTIDEFIDLEHHEVDKISETLFKKYHYKIKIADSGPFGLIYHEIGHKLHKDSLGAKTFNSLNWQKINSSKSNYANGMVKFINTEKHAANIIAPKLGCYAITSPLELVAEVFSCLANKTPLNDAIMEIYEKYDGPKV